MKRSRAIFFLCVIALSVVCIAQRPALFNRQMFHDDCNQYTFSYYKLSDPELFQDDIFTMYALRYNAKAVVFIYALFGKIIDPLILSKILPFLLCLIAALYAFLIGEETEGMETGFLAAVLLIMHSWTFTCFSGGHAIAFALPLLLSFVFYLLKKNYFFVTIIVFLQIFTYPPVAVISMTVLFFVCVLPLIRGKIPMGKARESVFSAVLLAAAFLTLCGTYMIPDDMIGPLFRFEEIIRMPEFYWHGRDPHFVNLFQHIPQGGAAANISGFPLSEPPTWILLFVSSMGLILLMMKKITVHRVIAAVGLSGIFLFFVSWLAFFYLFSPGRYIKFGVFAYLIFLSASALNCIFRTVSSKTRLVCLTAVILLVYSPFVDGNIQYYGNTGLYHFLSTLSKDALIAGHPRVMDEIPLLCKRKVFVQRESSLPYYKTYYGEIARRTRDFFNLYYSSDIKQMKTICREHGIDYLVIKKEHFSQPYFEQRSFYYEPFNGDIQRIVADRMGKGFLFQDIPDEQRLYEDEDFIVVWVGEKDFLP